ncbi:MAG: hypothetical protein CL489_02355 [Acidobacteria bacterium]|nr:hypothetical protein [Acidobacteriota bacterium]|tara:strand:+ start:917 stop:1234 length:318 start_codon:yes stop_codon:yes gene_type:complete
MNINEIMEAMEKGIVLLEYTSLISGNKKIREVTTCNQIIPKSKRLTFNQDPMSDKMLCYDLEFAKWDDINRDTIISWKSMSGTKKNVDYKIEQRKVTDLNWDGED